MSKQEVTAVPATGRKGGVGGVGGGAVSEKQEVQKAGTIRSKNFNRFSRPTNADAEDFFFVREVLLSNFPARRKTTPR